jgi:ArsR family transcriptional regulator, arsenate/arsenite/antimonite-responsive transcriptional repressor
MTVAAAPDHDRAVVLFHALSDATRLAALDMLREGERCVCELQDELDVAQSRLSFHLKVLKDAGLVQDRREGRWSYYTIVADALEEANELVRQFLPKSPVAGRRLHVMKARTGAKPSGRCCS